MKQIVSIAKLTIKENIYNRMFNGFIFFGIIIMFFSVVLKDLSLYEGEKVIFDTGIFLIEFFVLLITIYVSSTLFLKDKNEKSIYLILTKPVSKSMYIMGRLLGIISTILINLIIMGTMLAIILFWQGIPINSEYFIILLFTFYKLSILAGFGLLFSVISASFMTANIFTVSVYIISHAIVEMKMVIEKMENLIYKMVLNVIYILLPNYSVLNYKDYLKPVDINLGMITLYSFAYISVLLIVTILAFNDRKL